jgi:hypothetical protein
VNARYHKIKLAQHPVGIVERAVLEDVCFNAFQDAECTWSIMKIRNASVERSLFAGTLIRLMRYGAEKESSCIALDW